MANNQKNPGFVFGQIPTAAQWNGYFSSKQDANTPRKITNLTFTLDYSGDYAFTGASAGTWTLPLLTTLNSPYDVQNNTAFNLVLLGSASDKFSYGFGTTYGTVTLLPGQSAHIVNYGTFWSVQ